MHKYIKNDLGAKGKPRTGPLNGDPCSHNKTERQGQAQVQANNYKYYKK